MNNEQDNASMAVGTISEGNFLNDASPNFKPENNTR